MRRTAIAAAWLIGTTVPLVAAAVFVFGCCVLPFHGVLHKMMPVCGMAAGLMHHHDDGQQPAREKQEPVKRLATQLPRPLSFVAETRVRSISAMDAVAYRSFIALGAIRCDRDVGLHLLAGILLI